MGLFHKHKSVDDVKKDKQLIGECANAIDALLVLAEQSQDENIKSEFKGIQEKIKYLIASDNDKVYDYDKKIKNLIDDLRIVLVKNDSELNAKANKIITQIKLAIADRNVHI